MGSHSLFKVPVSKPITFAECQQLCGDNPKGWMRIANNTWCQPSTIVKNAYGIKLHHTEIITVYDTGWYRVYHGGFDSNTTCDRINRLAPLDCRMKSDRLWLADGAILLTIPLYIGPTDTGWLVRNQAEGGYQWTVTRL